MAAKELQVISPFFFIDDYTGLDQTKVNMALYEAITKQQFDLASKLIKQYHANVNDTLYIALTKLQFHCASILINEYGANVNYQDENGTTLLKGCVISSTKATWKFLVINDVDIQPDILTYIIKVNSRSLNEEQKIERIQFFLAQATALNMINFADQYGMTPLHCAYLRRHFGIINLLLACGANPDRKNDRGYRPLDLADKYLGQDWLMSCMHAMNFEVNTEGVCFGGSFSSMISTLQEYYDPQKDHPDYINVDRQLCFLYYDLALPAYKSLNISVADKLLPSEKTAVIHKIKGLLQNKTIQKKITDLGISDFLKKNAICQDPSRYGYLFSLEKKHITQRDIFLTLLLGEHDDIVPCGGAKLIANHVEIYIDEQLAKQLLQLRRIAISENIPIGMMWRNVGHAIYLGVNKEFWTLGDPNLYPLEKIKIMDDDEDIGMVVKRIEVSLKKTRYMILAIDICGMEADSEKISKALFDLNFSNSNLESHSIAELIENDNDSILALWALAICHNKKDIVRKLLVENYSADIMFKEGKVTPLHLACIDGSLQVLEALLSVENIPLNTVSCSGRTLLYAAVYSGKNEIVATLLNHISGDLKLLSFMSLKKYNGRTPLEFAIDWGYYEIVKTLLDNKDFCQFVFNRMFYLFDICRVYLNKALYQYRDNNHPVSIDKMVNPNALKMVRLILSHPNVPITPNWVKLQQESWNSLPQEFKDEMTVAIITRFNVEKLEDLWNDSEQEKPSLFDGLFNFFSVSSTPPPLCLTAAATNEQQYVPGNQ